MIEATDRYEEALGHVGQSRKPSPSMLQRVMQIPWTEATAYLERMERAGLVGPVNHAGRREWKGD